MGRGSRGWLSVETGKCYPFDTAIHVKTFYFRGETKTYHHQKSVWGNGKDFAVWERDNFQYYNADQRVLNSSLKGFTKVQTPKATRSPPPSPSPPRGARTWNGKIDPDARITCAGFE